ncbi:MAG: class I SAM-dependent RNA methyltransferase [Clostridia bacterium]|nr:class I SAM-dependent RNA methyltransferase [Clostridia bacterium]
MENENTTEKYELVATCMFGLEKTLGSEIDSLGLERVDTIDGRVRFRGTAEDICRANIGLRTAERVCLLLGEPYAAGTFDELFEGCRALPWERFITRNGCFPVSGHSVKSALTSIPDCQKILKKAICVRLGEKFGLDILPETGEKYPIEFLILKDEAWLMIDTSGTALHKRGYRPVANQAPLRETLAAAMVMGARIKEDIFLWDPFCGSGTIVIEGAMLAAGIAPGLNRTFCSEDFRFIPASAWINARNEAKSKISRDCGFRAKGTDIDPSCIKTAKENAKRAGVADFIDFEVADARKITPPVSTGEERIKGTLICNPPYGERMMSLRDAENLYRDIGKNFRQFERWQIYVLTSCEYFDRLFGRKSDKARKLYNGTIPCTLYQYFKPLDVVKNKRNFK